MNADEIVMWLRQNNRKSGWTDIDRMMDKSADLIESLQAQIAETQRRADAAVEDFTSAAHNGNILCEFCGADCIDAGNDTGGDTFQCGCFEWRGPPRRRKEARNEQIDI
jgi:hypothetical protein